MPIKLAERVLQNKLDIFNGFTVAVFIAGMNCSSSPSGRDTAIKKGMTMIRFALLFVASLSLAGCHTTDLGRSIGWQEPPASNM
ncbi:hypothetical protein OK142_22580 [Agrobacterium sp. BT-220-3]|nr:hypothetical protein [Agrobacterium sp. BT-220-3]